MKLLRGTTLCLLILGTFTLAGASALRIETDSGGIRGTAESAPLGQVLQHLAAEIGCDVYVDAPLLETPVSFIIEETLTPEKAIERMIRPHSYAMVFGLGGQGDNPKIREIWIFRKGEQHSASYVPVRNEDASWQASARTGVEGATDTAQDMGIGQNQAPTHRDLVRPNLNVARSSFGTPVVRGTDVRKGPDYRLTPAQMHQAFQRYQIAKHREERRMAETVIHQAQLNAERHRSAYLARRNQELKNQILESKQN